ncbi:MAG: hypothetical protein KKD93_00360, partial [Actinobacteria bacterium]|nr:hypothetical protein [Actinomycetota bacterium]
FANFFVISCLARIDSPLPMKLMIPFRGHSYVRHRNRFAGKIREARRPLDITSILAIIFGVIGLSRSENVVDVLGGPVGRSASKVGIILGSITFVITWLLTTLWLS